MTDTNQSGADKLFNAGNGSQTPPGDNLGSGQAYYGEMVGEGKPFADNEALAKGKRMADQHIKNLENEMKSLREELGKRATAEEFVNKLMEQIKVPVNTAPVSNDGSQNRQEAPNGSQAINTQDVSKLVKEMYEQQIAVSKANENVEYVVSELTKAYGDSYPVRMNEVSESLGLSKQEVARMAERSPKALLKLVMDNTRVDNSFAPPAGNSNGVNGQKAVTRTFKDYEKLRKENPVLYFDTKTQMQMHKDAAAYGDAFYK